MTATQQRTVREEKLQIEVRRLKAWLHCIETLAWREQQDDIQTMAREAMQNSSLAVRDDWGPREPFAKLGKWPVIS